MYTFAHAGTIYNNITITIIVIFILHDQHDLLYIYHGGHGVGDSMPDYRGDIIIITDITLSINYSEILSLMQVMSQTNT